jgi:septum site-determining protein MinC
MNNHANITIKGIKNGILVELDTAESWSSLTQDLLEQLDAKSSFFTGANITLELGERAVERDALTALKADLETRGLTIWSIMTQSAATIEAAHALDLKTNVANTVPEASNGEPEGQLSVVVKRTLRSGQQVSSAGNVIIIGDVNPGAEVVAVGDIIVWGRLRGTVHAGSEGDSEAMICALDMSPTQLRIANHIVTSPDDPRRKPQPEIALVRDNQIIVESWR